MVSIFTVKNNISNHATNMITFQLIKGLGHYKMIPRLPMTHAQKLIWRLYFKKVKHIRKS